MMISRFKNQVLFLILVAASATNAEYTIDDGTIRYVPVVTVSYSLESGQEVLETLPEGQALDFSMQQSAMFRNEHFKESFVPLSTLQQTGAIFDYDLPVELKSQAVLYQYFDASGSLCRIILPVNAGADTVAKTMERFLSKLKDTHVAYQVQKSHFLINCRRS